MKKIFLRIMLLLTLLCTFSCFENSGKETVEGKTKIRFATWDNAEDLEKQQKIVDEFNNSQDKIEVTLEAYGSNYDTKITAAMGSGDAPDVMYMWNYPKYSKGLMPLDDLIKKEGEAYEKDFYEALWNYNSYGGKKLGLPVGYTTHVLYFNKDLFDKNGLEYPTENWTWQDVYKAAEKITNSDSKIFGIAFPLKPDPYDYEMFAWSNKKAYTDKDGNVQGYLDSKETIEAFRVFQNMIKAGIATTTEDYGEKSFILGKVGMYINGSWSINKLKEKGVNFGIQLLPNYGDNKSESIISSSGVAISATTKNVDAAWEFAKFWTSSEMNKNRLGYEFPVLKSVVKDLKLNEDEINGKFYTMLERSQSHMPASFIVKDWSSLSEKLELALEKMFNKNTLENPEKVLSEAAK